MRMAAPQTAFESSSPSTPARADPSSVAASTALHGSDAGHRFEAVAVHGIVQRAPEDAGVRAVDAGVAAPDAGSGIVDAGTPDAGTRDAGQLDAGTACALFTFTGSNFVGEATVADVEFRASLESINAHAAANDVNLDIRDSFRTSSVVPGAIVPPAENSNHFAGHAIDMNVMYGKDKATRCNSTCLAGALPAGVSGFIAAIKGDAGLRWGGDWAVKDTVHIDDDLNSDNTNWKARRDATQAARKSGCG